MRKLFLLPFLLGLEALSGRATTADQHIIAVTVYPDRALVTREGTVTLPAGIQTVVFEHLPINLEEDSVRAKASSRATIKILGIEMRRDYHEVPAGVETKKLQDGVTKLEDQIRTLNDERFDISNQEALMDQYWERVVTSPPPAGSHGDTAQNIGAIFALYKTEKTKLSTRMREIDFGLRDLNRQHDALAQQLALLQQPGQANTRSALVTLDAGSGGAADVQVTYLIQGAGWQPQYDAYADSDTKKVDLTYYGVVRQSTGEDWNDVALTLSSSRPSLAARLPEMSPWTVDFFQPRKDYPTAMRLISDSAAKSAMNRSVAAQPTEEPGGVASSSTTPAAPPALINAPLATSQVESLGPASTFVVPARTTIPADNQPHRNAIGVQSLRGDWTYEAAPKLAEGAFLKTRVTNSSGGPLLAGPINVFLGNNFVGQSNIGLVAASASFDLFLGTDENIKLTRMETVAKEETGGLLTRQRIYRRGYTIEAENFKATAIDLKLRDQLPVSRNGEVTVVVDRIEPAATNRNADTGELTWTLKIPAGQKQKATVDYEVDAPYDKPVQGL